MLSIAEEFFGRMGFPKFSSVFDLKETQNLALSFGRFYNVFKKLKPSGNENQFANFFRIVGKAFAESDEVKSFLASKREISLMVCSNSFATMPSKCLKADLGMPENTRFFAFRAGDFAQYATVCGDTIAIPEIVKVPSEEDTKVKFAAMIWLFSESDRGAASVRISSLSKIMEAKLYNKVVNVLDFLDPPTTALSPKPMTHLPEDGTKMVSIAEKFFDQMGFSNFNSVLYFEELQKISLAFREIYNGFKKRNLSIDENQFAAFLKIVAGVFSQSDKVKSFLASSQDTCVILCSNSHIILPIEWFGGDLKKPENMRLFALRAGNFTQYAALHKGSATFSEIIEVPSDEDTRMKFAATIWFFSESDHGDLMACKSNLDKPVKVELHKEVVGVLDLPVLVETRV